jgi:predicted NUDIX family phosphoesterase
MAKKTATAEQGEQVLVVAREFFPEGTLENGFREDMGFFKKLMEYSFFLDREKAEHDPAYKQIIPQIVVRNVKGDVFVVQRLKTQGESRLHGKHSMGIGGHINPIDTYDKTVDNVGSYSDTFTAGLMRELREELVIEDLGDMVDYKFLGTMNDESNEVGTVHFAVVVQITFKDEFEVEINEKDKMVGGFVSLEEAATNYDNMENWSQIIFDHIRKE